MADENDAAKQARIMQFMTTEHFTLQTARASTVAESNGRIQLYIGAVSSAVVALAFIGQTAGMSESFFVFALVLFPSLLFLGIVTFDRVLQTALEDWMYAAEMNRIRHYYAEIAPEMKKYFIESIHDDTPGVMQAIGIEPHIWQFFLTGSGMVGVINSILIGVFCGLALKFGFLLNLYICATIGSILFAASVFVHYRRQIAKFTRIGNRVKWIFPKNAQDAERN